MGHLTRAPAPRAQKSASPSRAAQTLSKEAIIAATRELARKRGFGRVSMRVLGERLGVTATAIYYHFKNKHDLFEHVAASIFEEIAALDAQATWSEQLRSFVLAYQQRLVEYPGMARVILANRQSKAALLWSETILSILRRAGFDDRSIWPAFGMLVFFVNPMTLFDEKPHHTRQALYDPKAGRRAIDNSPGAFPNFTKLLGSAAPVTYEALLPVVLDQIIEHLRRNVRR